MTKVLALTQFVFLALLNTAVLVLTKVKEPKNETVGLAADFIRDHAVALLFLPIVWLIFAEVFIKLLPASRPVVQVSGILLAVLIILIPCWVIFSI